MPKTRRIDPNSKEGLGGTYHADANLGQVYGSGFNKYNYACTVCNTVYLNRWKAEECYDSHQPPKEDPYAKSIEHIEGNQWCTCEKCLPKFADCHNSPDGKHHFVGGAYTDKHCKYCLVIWDTSIHEPLVVRGMAFREFKFVGEK